MKKGQNLTQAVIAVMKAVKGIEKNTTVGSGGYSYQGVSDKDVKDTYNKAMVENGLCILPVEIQDETKETTWMEGKKLKRSIFCKVITKYKLKHESGESEMLSGYGHGIDSGDKAAGKATTYALKYALLYTFMTPTGKIDDADTTHSNDIPLPEEMPIVNGKPMVADSVIPAIIKRAIKESKTIKDIEGGLTLTDTQKATILKGLQDSL